MKLLALLLVLWPGALMALPEGAWDCRDALRRFQLFLDPDGSFLLQSPRGTLLGAGRAEARPGDVIFLYASPTTFPAGPGLTFALRLKPEGADLVGAEEPRLRCRLRG